MDLIEIISGRCLIEILGACVRFTYLNTIILFKKDDFITFSEIWSPKGNKNKKDANSERNHIIGVIFLGGIIFLLVIFTT
ncbi:hypothetical protein [Flavobacterium tructae]|uniref:Uncharacterized protein n=1 Tax=Flavobacterium tructae TaxID=1114873 RepID=A0A1S1JA60_9FLAO|nr:hypothetical protein [Flavobacterium tructae]OHT46046.1 hypothetical protein BHE19_00595 [Flavobacterium tructae]OXB22004.1 hypothetical protein B0A71_00620 [Flavobacterium tructae]